jgi:lysophospholipase L1-like esterase
MARAARRALILLGAGLLTLGAAELATRAYFATRVGPRILLYGTRWHRQEMALPVGDKSVQRHGLHVGDYRPFAAENPGSYAKYFPNEVKLTDGRDGDRPYEVHINNHGFRGKDFNEAKPPGVMRVLALGASSTFGYQNRDEETYPHYLEEILNRRAGGARRFEVINFAIPHATSDNVLALFLAEGVPLEPDFVTFYEGANDATIVENEPSGLAGRVSSALASRLLLVRTAAYFTASDAASDEDTWSEEFAKRRSKKFIENLQKLADECAARNIHFIVATQQARSLIVDRDKLQGVTYDDELALIREALARGDRGPGAGGGKGTGQVDRLLTHVNSRRIFTIHARLMNDMREWAKASGVPLVDTIKVLDQDRHLILTGVHLEPKANHMIADALAEEILSLAGAPAQAAAAPGS